MDQANKLLEDKIRGSISFAIVVPCFNEEQNIGELLELLCSGWNSEYRPDKIAVFSSECRDRTEEIVRNFSTKSSIPIILKTESKRSGKCHAINQLIEIVDNVDIIILVSSDIQISGTNLIKMLNNFKQKNIGVVAGRPIPVTDKVDLAYRVSKVLWDIHHLMALQSPKSTEITAFRNLGFRIDESSLVDEAEIEWNILKKGFTIAYCPSAIIFNKAPRSFVDFIRQRTRVTLGHFILRRKKKYIISSMRTNVRINALIGYITSGKVDCLAFTILLVIEVWVFLVGYFLAFIKGDTDGKWARIKSAKEKFT